MSSEDGSTVGARSSAATKLAQARFFLDLAQDENQQRAGRTNTFAVEAYLDAFLSMAQAAFYHLEHAAGKATFTAVYHEWRHGLSATDQALITGLADARMQDVHKAGAAVTVRPGAVPAHTWRRGGWSVEPDAMLPNPVPGASPAYAPAWVPTQETHLQAGPSDGCERALDLLDDLVRRFTPAEPSA